MVIARKRSAGFTLVELMVVVAIVGILAVLAVFGVGKLINGSKTAEAKNSVAQIAKLADMAYTKERPATGTLAPGALATVTRQLCASAAAKVPIGPVPQAQKYQSTAADWSAGDENTGWKCLKFEMNAPQYYQYAYTATAGTKFNATAQGDLDGNGTPSTFDLQGDIDNTSKRLTLNPIVETNPEE